ncbi:hypothetical protein PspLS_09575 [Pyricularia sp. CBS 133598]|nr:hypothetical protein PspLS_09575 [Pyricularia sp. CBS 133598]
MHYSAFFTTAATLLAIAPNYVVAVGGGECLVALVPDGGSFYRTTKNGIPGQPFEFKWGEFEFTIQVEQGCAGRKTAGTIPPRHFVSVGRPASLTPTSILRENDTPHPPTAVYPPPQAPRPDGHKPASQNPTTFFGNLNPRPQSAVYPPQAPTDGRRMRYDLQSGGAVRKR